MINKLDEHMRFHLTSVELRTQRQQLLASNIANADTPNFKARDFDFGSALKNAMSGVQPPSTLTTTKAGHLPGSKELGPGGLPLLYRSVTQGSVDGNTVDMDIERNQFADNAIRHEVGIMMLNSKIKGLMTAVQGGQ